MNAKMNANANVNWPCETDKLPDANFMFVTRTPKGNTEFEEFEGDLREDFKRYIEAKITLGRPISDLDAAEIMQMASDFRREKQEEFTPTLQSVQNPRRTANAGQVSLTPLQTKIKAVENIYNMVDKLLVARDMDPEGTGKTLMASVITSLTKLRMSPIEEDVVQYMRIMSHIHFVDEDLHTELNGELSTTGWGKIQNVNSPTGKDHIGETKVPLDNNDNNANNASSQVGSTWTRSSSESGSQQNFGSLPPTPRNNK